MAIASSITAAIIAAGATGGATVAASKIQSGSAKRAGQYASDGAAAALEFEREKDRLEREQYQQEYARQVQLEDEDRRIRDEQLMFTRNQALADRAFEERQYGERQGRLQPFQQAGTAAVRNLSSLLNHAPKIPVGRATRRPMDLM